MFFRLFPFLHGMKMTQPQLLVGLEERMRRVNRHWATVDRQLPADGPLALLQNVKRAGFDGLLAALPGLREGVDEAEVDLKLARGEYERLKRELHGWVGMFNRFLRCLQGQWRPMARRLPGLGRSYDRWSSAVLHILKTWRALEKNPPSWLVDWPKDYRPDWTLPNLTALAAAFDAAWWTIVGAATDLEIARGNLRLAQAEATALLMAYGHGVRARLGQRGALVRSIPQVWPKHKGRKKAA
jgi:hypothetical protein